MSVKIKDIANALGISSATVSLVLNEKPGVGSETREKVLRYMQKSGYTKKNVQQKSTKSIRFIIYKKHGKIIADTPFFSQLIEGIEQESRRNGYSLVVSCLNGEKDAEEVLSIVRANPLDGVIILATEMNSDDLCRFAGIGAPIVLLDSFFKGMHIDTVVINNAEGSYEAVRKFADLGHKRIGYLQSSIIINNFEQRRQGYIKALMDSGISFDKSLVVSLDPSQDGAFEGMRAWLNANSNYPTAFFADNDLIALGAVRAMKEHGIRIPEDVSVIGFDDMPFCTMVEPTLSTVGVYKQKMGMLAVRRLIEKIDGGGCEYVVTQVGTGLILRESCSEIKRRAGK